MNTSKASNGSLDVGMIALPLLCCLLAAVLVGFMSDSDRRDENRALLPQLHACSNQLDGFEIVLGRLGRIREQMVSQLNLTEYRKANAALTAKIEEARRKLELERQIAAILAELPGLSNRVEELTKKVTASRSEEVALMLGDYKGDYVLIECVRGGVVVHPGPEKFPETPSESDKRRLLDRIEQVGFVSLLARPDGWHGASFDHYRKWIYAHLDDLEKNSGKVIGRITLPLEAHEPIEPYLPATR